MQALVYAHGAGYFEGDSITGGVVNQEPVGAPQGPYNFRDFISKNIWCILAANLAPRGAFTAPALTRRTDLFTPDEGAIDNISSCGTDDAGNVHIADFDGEIFRLETR